METKIKDRHVDESLGFRVVVRNAPMKKFRGEWMVDIDPDEFARRVLWELVTADRGLTGDHVRFIRHWFDETLEQFGKPLDVSAPGVTKWEKKGENPTGMTRGTEFQIRARVVNRFISSHSELFAPTFTDVFERIFFFESADESGDIEIDGENDLASEIISSFDRARAAGSM